MVNEIATVNGFLFVFPYGDYFVEAVSGNTIKDILLSLNELEE